MVDHREIYNNHAEQYDLLVAHEDCQGNILPALTGIHPIEGQRVVELGAGTGRLTRLLAPLAKDVWLFDASQHMLEVAARSLERGGHKNWRAAVADHRSLPLMDGMADVVISGWSVCYLAVWNGEGWRREVRKGLREMQRVLGHRGTIILLETLGTGCEQPEEPDKLRPYYEYLADEGFARKWIRTDLEFESMEEAQELVEFFFGEEMTAKLTQEKRIRLPECTGVWWRSQQ
jgi:ubiquinone/menaquinone biosynthesis C-methylase UbiE